MEPEDEYAIRELPERECWDVLRGRGVGRLAVIVDGHPEIFPVNYVVDHGTVVFRSDPGSKIEGARAESGVAFEVDGFDPAAHEAFSVVVKGSTEVLHSIDDITASQDLSLSAWQQGAKSHFLRIVPTAVTGRRFRVVVGGAPPRSLSSAPTVPPEPDIPGGRQVPEQQ